MASALASQKFFSKNLVQMWDHDPNTASAIMVTPDGGTTDRVVDMSGYEGFAVIAMASLSVGAMITKLEIIAGSDSALSADVTVVKDSGTVAADAVGDYVCLECSAQELAQLSSDAGLAVGAGLRYVAGRLTCANSGDEAVVTYIRFGAKFNVLDLTANTIA